jgi:DNA-binding MurR/RpiR family transcriptional regulator
MSKILKAHKIPIILLTGAKQSKIGDMADEVLYCNADEAANKIGSFASRSSMIFVLDCIYSLIFSMNYEKNIVSLNKYSLMIKDFRSKN